MKAVIVEKPKGPFDVVERPIPVPGPGEVVLKVKACGVCHGDKVIKDGEWPHLVYPRVPGHEVVGAVHAVGAGVGAPYSEAGALFGVGWHGGHCGECGECRRGFHGACRLHLATGITLDGGLAEFMVVRAEALVRLPPAAAARPATAAPLMCAGLTVFNGLRECGLPPGAFVGVHGIGGLGSLAIQFARRLGLQPVAFSTSDAKRTLAADLGAAGFINTKASTPAALLEQLDQISGGARLAALIATAPSADSIEALFPALAFRGIVVILAATDRPIHLGSNVLLGQNLRVIGVTSGHTALNEASAAFANAFDIHPLVEEFSIDQIQEAYDRMLSGKARFRSVITF